MFKRGFVPVDADRPMREFVDVEEEFKTMTLGPFEWAMGARRQGDVWRVIVHADTLAYDVAVPGNFPTIEAAIDFATRLGLKMGGVPYTQVEEVKE